MNSGKGLSSVRVKNVHFATVLGCDKVALVTPEPVPIWKVGRVWGCSCWSVEVKQRKDRIR